MRIKAASKKNLNCSLENRAINLKLRQHHDSFTR